MAEAERRATADQPSPTRPSTDTRGASTTSRPRPSALQRRMDTRKILEAAVHSLSASQEGGGVKKPRIGPHLWHACGLGRLSLQIFFVIMAHIGLAILYGVKVTLSLAIVVMINYNASKATPSECPDVEEEGDDSNVAGPRYDWDSKVEAHILASYFYGYFVGQIPGAILADVFSAMWTMWLSVLVSMLGCAFTPLVCRVHWGFLVAVRIIMGLAGAVIFPVLHILISNWAPPELRSVFSGTIFAGTAIGMVGSALITGFVSLVVGWENMFYITAALCVPWLVLWVLFLADKPPPHEDEEEEEAKGKAERPRWKLVFPVKAVFTSLPFWAILIAHLGGNFCLYCLIVEIPSFMRKVLHVNLHQNTILTCIPYIAMFVVSNVTGSLLDLMRAKQVINTTNARKIGATISMVIPAVSLVGLSHIGCNETFAVVCITIATGAIGAMSVSYLSNHIDISPRYAGLLIGITNTVATIPGFIVPEIFGKLTHEKNTLVQWSIGFYLIAALQLCAYIFYMVFASGEVQPWNEEAEESEETSE